MIVSQAVFSTEYDESSVLNNDTAAVAEPSCSNENSVTELELVCETAEVESKSKDIVYESKRNVVSNGYSCKPCLFWTSRESNFKDHMATKHRNMEQKLMPTEVLHPP